MSNLITLQRRGLTMDQMDVIITVLAQLAETRQVLFNYRRDNHGIDLNAEYERAEAAYQDFCRRHDLPIHPVFDEIEHRRKRVAEGDPDFVALYGKDFPEEVAAFRAKAAKRHQQAAERRHLREAVSGRFG